MVLVTHRVAAAARCDKVFVLDNGHIVEAAPTRSSSRAAVSTGVRGRAACREQLEALGTTEPPLPEVQSA